MKRMNRVLWIDTTNMMACIQAGAVGRHIMNELKKYGVTMELTTFDTQDQETLLL